MWAATVSVIQKGKKADKYMEKLQQKQQLDTRK